MTGLFVAKLLNLASHQSTMLYSMAIASVMLIGMSFSVHPAYLLIFTLFFGSFNALNRIARTNWMHHTIRVEQRSSRWWIADVCDHDTERQLHSNCLTKPLRNHSIWLHAGGSLYDRRSVNDASAQ